MISLSHYSKIWLQILKQDLCIVSILEWGLRLLITKMLKNWSYGFGKKLLTINTFNEFDNTFWSCTTLERVDLIVWIIHTFWRIIFSVWTFQEIKKSWKQGLFKPDLNRVVQFIFTLRCQILARGGHIQWCYKNSLLFFSIHWGIDLGNSCK